MDKMIIMEQRINDALAVLQATDLAAAAPGKHEISETFFFMVQEYETHPREDARFETHEKYIDIQLIVSGEEDLFAADVGRFEEEVPYDGEKDIAFWKPINKAQIVHLTPGGYVVLYPNDAHAPGLGLHGPQRVRKAVGKVYIGDLV